MTKHDTLARWSAEYTKQQSAGAPGWAGADSYRLKQERIAEALSEHTVKAPATFLELGCGAGNISLWMAMQGFDAYGVDVVPEAIQWAEDKAAQTAVKAHFAVADLALMPMFHDGQFDLIFDGDCFHMITDKHRADCFREVRRVLKPGGLLIAGGNVRDTTITQPMSLYHGAGSFTPATRTLLVPTGIEYLILSESELCAELAGAGFTVLSVKHHPARGGARFVKESIAVHATRSEDSEPAPGHVPSKAAADGDL